MKYDRQYQLHRFAILSISFYIQSLTEDNDLPIARAMIGKRLKK